MKDSRKQAHIAEEAFIVETSGEIPEVAMHSSIYYLTEDPDGPALQLDSEDILLLKQAVAKRYRAIILRDLDPGNRDKGIYRGLARCAHNWQRLLKFCAREKIAFGAYRVKTAEALQRFLLQEIADTESGIRTSSINCSSEVVENLAGSLGLAVADLPQGWRMLCPNGKSEWQTDPLTH